MISLEHFIDGIKDNSDYLVVGGDWNMTLNPKLDSEGNAKCSRVCVEQLKELMGKFDLFDAYREKNPDKVMYSWAPAGSNKNGTFRRLDYFLVSSQLLGYIEENEYADTHVSDHRKVRLVIDFNPNKDNERTPGMWRHNDELNKKEDFKKECKAAIVRAIMESKGSDARAQWEYIKYKIRGVSRRWNKEIKAQTAQTKHDIIQKINFLSTDPRKNIGQITDLTR